MCHGKTRCFSLHVASPGHAAVGYNGTMKIIISPAKKMRELDDGLSPQGTPRYLDRAVKAAAYWLGAPTLPADGVPYWDFRAADIPNEERDASAACVTLSALCELMDYVPAEQAAAYRAYVEKTLAALASPAYFAAPGENGSFLLKHSVGCKPHGGEVDVPLNYADYYFLETLVRSHKKGILR